MSKIREQLKCEAEYASEARADDKVINVDIINGVIDEIEGAVISIREKLEAVIGLDLIDEVVNELKELETKLY